MGLCDTAEQCTGFTTNCPVDGFRASGMVCNASVDGPCDVPDECTGASGECLPRFLADVECRASAGGCDLAELCTGDVTTCPPDQVSPSGTVCRGSTELGCDPLESCDGTATTCPADIITCERTDSGPPDGGGSDGGAPVAAAGCACRVSGSGPSHGSILGLTLLALVLGLCRRR